ncbi:MAG: phosphate acetyltransferase, partial [Alphaproteobacteria bacterium]
MEIPTELIDRARARHGTVVLPEGEDERIVTAARRLADQGLARPVVLGPPDAVSAVAARAGVSLDGISLVDPATSARREAYATLYAAGRSGAKANPGLAARLMRKPLYYGAMMVRAGDADAVVAGAANPTRRVLEAGMLGIGPTPGIETPSSFFLMLVPRPGTTAGPAAGSGERRLIFADCALNIDPDPAQLADIAIASAASARRLLDTAPRVALLSFSTRGSARHGHVEKVTQALEIAR